MLEREDALDFRCTVVLDRLGYLAIVLSVFGLGVFTSAAALAADETRADSSLLVDHWTMRDGLPQNSVLDILEDQDGLIWVATFGGVSTFDGLNFQRVDHRQYPGLLANRFVSLAQTPDGTMWLGSEHDGVFRLQGGQAEQLGPAGTTWSLVVDPQGQLFALVGDDVFVLEGESLTPVPLVGDALALGLNKQGAFVSGKGAAPQCLSADCGVLPALDVDWEWSRWTPLDQGWVVMTSEGVFVYQDGALREKSTQVLFSRRDQVCLDWGGAPWCLWGTEPQPMAQGLLQPAEDLNRLGYTRSAYLQDKEGGLWVGSDGSGLFRYQERQAENVYLGTDTEAVVSTSWGEIWFLSGGHINTLDGVLERLVDGLSTEAPHQLLFAARGQTYELIQQDGEVHLVLHEQTGSRVMDTLSGPGLGSAAVEGPWVVRRDVLYFLDVNHKLLRAATLHSQSEGYIWAVRGDDTGVWLAERGVGLHRFEDGAIQATYPWTGSVIRDLVEMDGELWVGTYGEGLVRLAQGKEPLSLEHHDGLCDEMISHLYWNDSDQLWFNSNAGLGRVPVNQVSAFFAGERADVECALVGSAEGNGSYGAVDGQGHFWAATIQGLAIVDPEESLTSLTPRLRISEARYGDQAIQDGARVRGKGSLSLSYRGLLYSDPKGVRYRYRMVGLDDAWSPETSVQRVDFSKLQPGRYTFEVQARGSGGWGEVERLSFRRQAKWFERRIARTGVPLLVLFGMLFGLVVLWRQNERLRGYFRAREGAQAELEKQREENQRIYQELEVGRRLEALGRLSGGVAHDVNNLLTVVAVHAGILESHNDPQVREEGEALRDVVDRGTEVTRGLLAFGRDRGARDSIMNLGEEVREVVPMLRRLIRSAIQLKVQAEPNCGVDIRVGALHQLLSNLILNARDAIPNEGEIWIRVRSEEQTVLLEIEDNGAGMAPEALERAFEPYFTTKALGQGTGLGLSTVRGVVQELGGQISMRSSLGVGSCVTVSLPKMQVAEHNQVKSSVISLAPLGLDVLIVEDRPEVLKAVELLVRRLGCRAVCAHNLQEAVAKIATEEVDMVLSDVMMPGGSGPEVIDALRQFKPGLPALLMSGYTGQVNVELGDTFVLQKPFSKLELRKAIEGLLGH
ncbi:MAG: signal transduction histidine kinase/CheY-like chemotaxis protein [Cognaticolwellia sp.]